MPREAKLQYCVCENRIREGDRKYSATASLLLRVYAAVKTEKRVKMGNYLCKSCRNKYDWWRRLISVISTNWIYHQKTILTIKLKN